MRWILRIFATAQIRVAFLQSLRDRQQIARRACQPIEACDTTTILLRCGRTVSISRWAKRTSTSFRLDLAFARGHSSRLWFRRRCSAGRGARTDDKSLQRTLNGTTAVGPAQKRCETMSFRCRAGAANSRPWAHACSTRPSGLFAARADGFSRKGSPWLFCSFLRAQCRGLVLVCRGAA